MKIPILFTSFLVLVSLFSGCKKITLTQEKIMGTWIGGNCNSAQPAPHSDTFQISRNQVIHSTSYFKDTLNYKIKGNDIFYKEYKIYTINFVDNKNLQLTYYNLVETQTYCTTKR